ncbi:hypothetical protein K8I61_17880 [bacterium]|nr:hypothetical protein [bacterium]
MRFYDEQTLKERIAEAIADFVDDVPALAGIRDARRLDEQDAAVRRGVAEGLGALVKRMDDALAAHLRDKGLAGIDDLNRLRSRLETHAAAARIAANGDVFGLGDARADVERLGPLVAVDLDILARVEVARREIADGTAGDVIARLTALADALDELFAERARARIPGTGKGA